ncbi:GNAT family N-acetyltransferase, partial [Kineococcus arenarius]|uniref:GNAT family N-acetyltransferase n=1 Tax=unclassified Kineococcus TaxID=2621656 RepID=UPI003D7E0D33
MIDLRCGALPDVVVRPATPADVDGVRDVADQAYSVYVERIGRRPAPMDSDYLALIGQRRVWVAELEHQVVGILVLTWAHDHVQIDNVAVAAACRGHRIGHRLLQHAEEQARIAGLAEVRLYTNEAMSENLTYYPRRGYRETHRATQDGYR